MLARLAAHAGHEVLLAGSGEPSRVIVPARGVTAVVTVEAASAEVVVLALPLVRALQLPEIWFADRLVVDATNRWLTPPDDPTTSTSERVQQHLQAATVVKALGHVGYQDLEDAASAGLRLGLAVAGPRAATDAVGAFIATLGFEPVRAGDLADGVRFEPDTELFGAVAEAVEARVMLDRFWESARGRVVARARGL